MRKSWFSTGLLLAVFAAFFGTALGASLSLADLLERDAQRREALQTQADLQRLLTLLVDIETGQRGFIITGQPEFLQPYDAARSGLAHLQADLRERLARSGVDAALLQRLDTSIRQRLAQVAGNIELRTSEGDGVLRDAAVYSADKREMDELREAIASLQTDQQRRVDAADAATERVERRAGQLTRLLPAVGLMLLLAAVVMLVAEHRQRDRAEIALREANANLEHQVAERTAALSRALQRIQSFAVELDRGVEEERRRLAREVHDQVGQVGTSIKMLTISLRSKLKPRVEPLLDEIQAMADEAIRSARQIAAALRPPLLDELGLGAALDHYLRTLQRQSGVATMLDTEDTERLTREQASLLFRIVQEACTNVLRHAGASTLTIAGRVRPRDGQEVYELEVLDDGRGPGSTRADASGLRNMRERAALGGGAFEFGPAPGHGARACVWLPLEAAQQENVMVDEASA
ncbi:MAG: CHASE3 domain-containing protein [Paucibacter sp.]|nr:CHASE3 domain-containing protein [Roseateles sp.]